MQSRLLTALMVTLIVCFSIKVQAYRLPSNDILEYQSVNLTLSPEQKTFKGQTTLDINYLQSTTTVSYHARALTIKSVKLTHQGQTHTLNIAKPNEFDIVTHQLAKPITGKAQLTIRYEGEISQNTMGLFVADQQSGSPYVFSQLQEMEARTVFPGFDAPDKKTRFEFSVDIPKQYDALHNTPVVSSLVQGERKIVRFAPSHKIYTDVLALAVGEFHSVELKDTPFNSVVYAPKNTALNLPTDMSELVSNTITFMERYLQYPFPYSKLDFFVAPINGLAAMENVGLIALNNHQIPELDADGFAMCRFRKLIAHEVVHMWFGNDITMNWYNDYWMNESFAEFFAAKAMQALYPQAMGCAFNPQSSAFFDDKHSARALRSEVKYRGDNEAIGQLAYTKGRSVLEMAELALGQAQFKTQMRAYVKQVAGANTSAPAFTAHFANTQWFEAFLNSFITQSNYPLLTLSKNDDQVFIQQSSFDSSQDKRWTIPLTLKIWNGKQLKTHKIVLGKVRMALTNVPANAQIFLDTNGVGYFRYLDNTGNGEFPVKKLSTAEQASYIDNQEALAMAAKVDFMTYIDSLVHIINTLPHNTLEVSNALSSLQNTFVTLIPESLSVGYAHYLRAQLPNINDWLPILANQNGGLWLELYGVHLGASSAITAAKQAYKNAPLSELAHRTAVLRVLVANAGEQEYQTVLSQFAQSEKHVKEDLLDALGYGNTHSQIQAFYDLLLSEATKGHDIDYRFQFPAFTPKHRAYVGQYIVKHKAAISQRIAGDKLQWFPYNFITACSAKEAELVKNTFADWQDVQGLDAKLNIVLETINECAGNSKSNLQSVRKVLAH
ncbi:aminopeptidase N [Pseudoalteromonas sp. A25]|uniref:M1 family metallopeptidase n=1 Tax=Pseudoalteromonas sp. A25 TaxID=116092 RepID=UPI0012604A23|nr:M1 family metallopeptidase [Pseudoalteromonas sp. A25]BBN82113.1 aminopeptidase N [Pseudoalteromonas sp. A25]